MKELKNMQTISQVAKLTGISPRTLQYYDASGLLKPSGYTATGYRLYDTEALEKLQQILFFKELGFKLKEIQEFISQPDFDKIAAYKKQKELLLLKRNRINRLIQLLDRLEKGEQCMSFKEFDLSDYIQALENFKKSNSDLIIKYWGNVENFDRFVRKIKDDESEVAKLAIKYYGSIEKYTEAMTYNLEHFSEIMEKQFSGDTKKILRKSDDLYAKLTSDVSKDSSSDEIQQIVQEMDHFMHENAVDVSLDKPYWNVIINAYSSDYVKAITDSKYGAGASDYIVSAFKYYAENHSGGHS